jgi:hypothetical protein
VATSESRGRKAANGRLASHIVYVDARDNLPTTLIIHDHSFTLHMGAATITDHVNVGSGTPINVEQNAQKETPWPPRLSYPRD